MANRSLRITSNLLKNYTAHRIAATRKMSSDPNDVIFESVNGKGVLTLNRPKALNSLNLSMVSKILPTLQKWEKEMSMVIVKGTGGKAFCAGGDVRAVIEAGKAGTRGGHDFFRTEYTMNGVIGTYKIPYIALIDGIVMGGGVGLSVHGHYRVATEKTMFAMPETIIGLFPDVGGSYFLPRLGGKLGTYLALSGERLLGSDVTKAGIATHYCNSSKLPDLEKAILATSNEQDLINVLNKFNEKDGKEFAFAPFMDKINNCFGGNTIEEILDRLQNDGSDWAKKTRNTLLQMSPTSLKISLKELQLGANMSLIECLQMEYRLACGCLSNSDFYEGVRAKLIDKDQKPQWHPNEIQAVTDSIVAQYFKKLPDDEELKHKL